MILFISKVKQQEKKVYQYDSSIISQRKSIPLRFRVLTPQWFKQSIVISHIDKLGRMEHANGGILQNENWIDGVKFLGHQIQLSVKKSRLSENDLSETVSDTLTQAIYGVTKQSRVLQGVNGFKIQCRNILALQGLWETVKQH